MGFETTATISSFGGKLLKLKHYASTLKSEMNLNLYLPPHTAKGDTQQRHEKIPVLFFLSGLTCTGDNCAEKGFLHYRASQRGIAIVYPDTSPRGLGIEGEENSYDFGSGASFYIDATNLPWSTNYNMDSYVTRELPGQLFDTFKELDSSRISITGHSMGGHGALTLFLKNPGMYRSVSAFAPICNPINCPWGQKAFSGYLGNDFEEWRKHDATELVKEWHGPLNCLIDVGTSDQFYQHKQLLPENFAEEAKKRGNDHGLILRYQEVCYIPPHLGIFTELDQGYDHSYYFVSSFATDHVNHAANYLFA
ncbi:S-formylglutathione hydrolase [Golovinomyces cichoracearum]|uniref:S-formylglutathione hydrolase n=1 Tax=Golovinomyces cichoracearum TaxID=62708 RepID=A0A420I154_9PEZI|nr:S-formylglutathione hydrolase [Golovinomyces cichoracearum]